ncbi:sensor histidine kinase [Rubinisphaera italica]|uniref:Oxygen sensor histidine kinase NreB n=1 Tax=Rubinisphaera italica TaxID=2527969 RepID=A0A5C5X9N5_9PLAN|nr:PAS domain S-box protein [Rubinisphaera italica]TWT59660.1 Sensor protein FixL [Rubinisphaera italica]
MNNPADKNADSFSLLRRTFADDQPNVQWLLQSLDRSAFGILIIDPHLPGCPIIYANQSVIEMSGFGLEELLNHSPDSLWGNDQEQHGIKTLLWAIDNGRECRVVLRNYRKDGRLFWNEITLIPVRDQNLKIKCFIQILSDVSNYEKTRTEKEIVEDTLRSILNSAEDAIITINDRGIIQDLNLAAKAIFGYQPEELLGQNINILMPSPYHEEHDGYLRNFLETGITKVIGVGREVIAKRKNGSVFPAEIAINQVDHKRLFTGIVRDLTERKRSEELLRKEHDLNQKIISTSRSIILMLDPNKKILQFNSCFEQLTGRLLKDSKNKDFGELFIHATDHQHFQTSFTNAISGQSTRELCPILLTQTGERLIVEWETVPMTSRTGMVVALLCTGVNVTEQRRLEREVLEIATEEQRRIGQDLHDVVGQELTGMAMLAESLAVSLQGADAKQLQLAQKIARGTSEALRKVRLLSKGLNPVDIDAAGLMAALNSISSRIRENHKISCEFKCPSPVFLEDNIVANQLYRIAEEATTNAIKHAQATYIVIELLQTEENIILMIQDDGIGLQESEGSGLGLRIMRYRANRMGGGLSFEGSEFGGTLVKCIISAASMKDKNV